jgi:hypothetical protein
MRSRACRPSPASDHFDAVDQDEVGRHAGAYDPVIVHKQHSDGLGGVEHSAHGQHDSPFLDPLDRAAATP